MEGGQALKVVLGIWRDAVEAYTGGDFEGAIENFLRVEELTARMLYNMACAYIRLDKTTLALQCLSTAVKKDTHLAIAFFQKGVLNLKQNNYKGAYQDLGQAKTLMRGNTFIDYKPLGMYTKLGKFEILYNMALACLHDNRTNEAEGLFTEALHDADIRQRKLLISALEHVQDKTTNLITPVQISVTNIFAPPKNVVENLEKRNVMASAKVVSAADKNDTDPTFNGMKRVKELRRSPQNSPKVLRSPLLKVKQLLWKQSRTKSASLDDMSSVRSMRPTLSTGDIRSLSTMHEDAEGSLSHSMTSTGLRARSFDGTFTISPLGESPTSSLEDFDMRPRTNSSGASFRIVHSVSLDSGKAPSLNEFRQTSIEEVCNTSSACIAQALTSNCDVTIVVTPPATTSNNDPNTFNLIPGNIQQNGNINVRDSIERPTETNEIVLDSADNGVEVNNNINPNDIRNAVEAPSPRTLRRTRPPPPSYPPPPLPSKVVFTI